jgi:NADPH:quinone reductase-like Zn-dependent oxidoreductase
MPATISSPPIIEMSSQRRRALSGRVDEKQAMMRVYRYDDFESLDHLRIHEEEMPQPQRGELLLRVHAVSLNYRDLAVVLGRYVQAARPGLVPVSDAAAEVVAVGEDVEVFKPGDRVISAFHPRWFGGRSPANWVTDSYGTGRDGWLAEFKTVSQEAVVLIPDSLSNEEGATLPCAAATAWCALAGPTPIRAGHTVLTQGTGGVSIFALQLAKKLGARVISTTSSTTKAEKLRSLGADEVINYSEIPQWGDRAKELTGGRGVDRVVEVGGPATVNQSLRAVAWGGEIVLIGFLTEKNPGIDYFVLKGSGATIRSLAVGDRANLEDLVRAVSMTGLKPVIDRVFEFVNAREAFVYLKEADATRIGKIVIRVSR